jgi:glycosyltransferase involved in cell wall biosynthesis
MPIGQDNSLGSITIEDVPIPRVEIELSDPAAELQLVHAPANIGKVLALVRLHTHPLGTVVLDGASGISWRAHASAVWAAMSQPINAHLIEDGLQPAPEIDALRATTQMNPECARRRATILASAPRITVVVATRERPNQLRACLDSLLQLQYPEYEVLVVDNDPVSEDTARLIEENFGNRVRYLREDRRGQCWARNRGLKAAETGIVAFTDDDVVVDRHWLTGIAEGFAAATDVACVTGPILPEQLDTPSQLLLHHQCGWGNFRFVQAVVDMGDNKPNDPAFPLTVGRAGSGPNMAFATPILRRLGGFDPALGAGTKLYGGDETAAFVRIVLRHQLVYQPAAIVWHRHQREMEELKKSPNDMTTGAFLASVMLHEPAMWGQMLRSVPAGIAWAVSSSSRHHQAQSVGPQGKREPLKKLSILFGPIRYAVSRWKLRKLFGPQDTINS